MISFFVRSAYTRKAINDGTIQCLCNEKPDDIVGCPKDSFCIQHERHISGGLLTLSLISK